MHIRNSQIIFQFLIILTLFSYWAGFALLVVNKLFHKDLPGYTIGRICIWEFVALFFAYLISRMLIKKWGTLKIQEVDNELKITMHPKYGIYFLIFFLTALIVGIWQFYLFSQKF